MEEVKKKGFMVNITDKAETELYKWRGTISFDKGLLVLDKSWASKPYNYRGE